MDVKNIESGLLECYYKDSIDNDNINNRDTHLPNPNRRDWMWSIIPTGWKNDPSSLMVLLFSLIAYIIFIYIMTVMSNIASYLSPINMKPLNDVGFRIIPMMNYLHLTDLSILISLSITWTMIVLFDKKPITSSIRILQNSCLISMFRTFTIAITSFPDPRSNCSRIEGNFLTTFVLHRCGDCMFSGHTASVTILALHWISVKRSRYCLEKFGILYYFCKCISIICVPLGIWAIISNRTHYSVDVIVSLIISITTWISWHYVTDKMKIVS